MENDVKAVSSESDLSAVLSRYISHASTTHSAGTVETERVATAEFLRFFGDIPINQITAERADAWVINLSAHFMQNTRRTRICVMKSVYHYAMSIGIVKENPFDNIRLPKMVFSGRYVADKILRDFFAEFPLKMRRALRLILNTGMRKTEAVMLDWSEVQGNKIVLPPERTKNRKGRTIYLNTIARRCLGPRPPCGGRVFDFSPSYLNKYATAAWKKMGIGRIRIHDLRHTAATRHYDKNHDDYTMMDAFGWSNIESAQPYHHLTDARIKKSMARLSHSI